jgi:hypothetical protein
VIFHHNLGTPNCGTQQDGSPDSDDWGHGPQPREMTRRTMTRGGYLLRVRCLGEPEDDDEDHDRHCVA